MWDLYVCWLSFYSKSKELQQFIWASKQNKKMSLSKISIDSMRPVGLGVRIVSANVGYPPSHWAKLIPVCHLLRLALPEEGFIHGDALELLQCVSEGGAEKQCLAFGWHRPQDDLQVSGEIGTALLQKPVSLVQYLTHTHNYEALQSNWQNKYGRYNLGHVYQQ